MFLLKFFWNSLHIPEKIFDTFWRSPEMLLKSIVDLWQDHHIIDSGKTFSNISHNIRDVFSQINIHNASFSNEDFNLMTWNCFDITYVYVFVFLPISFGCNKTVNKTAIKQNSAELILSQIIFLNFQWSIFCEVFTKFYRNSCNQQKKKIFDFFFFLRSGDVGLEFIVKNLVYF